MQAPNDVSYVYSGYAPLSVRLAQFLAQPGWRAIQDVLKKLPGPTVCELQQRPPGMRPRRKHPRKAFLLWLPRSPMG